MVEIIIEMSPQNKVEAVEHYRREYEQKKANSQIKQGM